MIIRIVKISLQIGKRQDFINLFNISSRSILQFEGCLEVCVLPDCFNENQAFTYSKWHSLQDLENYRKSAFFEKTWKEAKLLFSEKAEAWSLEQV